MTHQIDPETIKPGQWAHFQCSEDGCGHHHWHHWQPASAVSRFGDHHCYMHGRYPGPVMVIVEVNDDGPPGFDPTRPHGFEPRFDLGAEHPDVEGSKGSSPVPHPTEKQHSGDDSRAAKGSRRRGKKKGS